MRILYFAWLREKIGTGREEVSLPAEVRTVRDAIAWLRLRSEGHRKAFENAALIRCALDQEFAQVASEIGDAAELAFFPPVTGG